MSYTIVPEEESLIVVVRMLSINEVNFPSLFNLVGLRILGLKQKVDMVFRKVVVASVSFNMSILKSPIINDGFLTSVELASNGFDVKSFPRKSLSRGGGIATICKSILGSNITFNTIFDFTHTSFEVVQATITLQYNTLHFFCLYRPPPNRRNNITDSMCTEQLPDLLDYINNRAGLACLVGDMNIHFDNPLQSLT